MKLLQSFILIMGALGVWADVKAQLRQGKDKCQFYLEPPEEGIHKLLLSKPFEGKRSNSGNILTLQLDKGTKDVIDNVEVIDRYCSTNQDKIKPVSAKIISGGVGSRFVRVEIQAPISYYSVEIRVFSKT